MRISGSIYSLVYVGGSETPETWIASSCLEIVDCLQDFMFDDKHPEIYIYRSIGLS